MNITDNRINSAELIQNTGAGDTTGKDVLFPLGFRCTRFSLSEIETEKLIHHAIDAGVNYFDTAILYDNSQSRLGKILKKFGLREQVKIATKVPPYLIKSPEDFDRYLNQSLLRLRTDYIDYYQIHMISDFKMWERLVQNGVIDWATQQKAKGRIKNFGFSYHGGRDEFVRIIDSYDWDFCLIQYNYLNKLSQAGDDSLHYVHSKGIPIFVVNPLGSGRLADGIPKTATDIFAQSDKDWGPGEWALRWLWNQSEITCVLPNMNSMNHLRENIRIAIESYPNMLTEDDHDTIAAAKQAIIDTVEIYCSACNYCLPCPQNVDIPTCLITYRNRAVEGKITALRNYITRTSLKKKSRAASRCNQCGICEIKCPQKIPIRKELAQVEHAFEKFYFKPIVALAKRVVALAKRVVAPAKRVVALAKRVVAPAKRVVAPAKRVVALAKRIIVALSKHIIAALAKRIMKFKPIAALAKRIMKMTD